VQEWINNHSGEAIAKIENGDYFILFYDGWQKTVQEEFEKLRNGIYHIEKDIRFVDGNWEVNYLSKIGPSPSRIQVIVNGGSGEVLSLETFER
jgi:hypothetical protein